MFSPALTANIGHFVRFITIGVILSTLFSSQWITTAQDDIPSLTPFQAVGGMLDATTLRDNWTFDGQEGMLISIVAERVEGDLDVVVELRNSENQLLVANDNADRTTTDARIEAYVLPADDTYRIAVYREGLRLGNTSGIYKLTLLLGYSTYNDNQTTAALATDTLQSITTITAEEFYLTTDVTMPNDDTYQLAWRLADTTGIQWIFNHDITGNWTLSIETAENTVIRSVTGTSTSLPTQEQAVSFVFHRTATTLDIYADENLITSSPIVEGLLSVNVGDFSIQGLQGLSGQALFNNIRLTTAYYLDDPSLIALPPSRQRIYNYDASPSQVIGTLRDLALLPPPTETSGLQGDIVEGFITNDEVSYNAYPLIERPFRNFVLSWTASFLSGPSSAACGVIFRQTSQDTFATVLHTPAAGLYMFQVNEGLSASDGVATISPFLEQGLNTGNTFTLVMIDDIGTLFINGRWVAETSLFDISGLTLTHLVLDSDVPTYCQIEQLWLWSLD